MSDVVHPTLEELRRIDLFDDIDDQQLELWREVAVVKELPPDALLAEARDATSGVFLLLKGVVQGLIFEGGRLEPVTRQVAPTWMGAITVLTETGFAGEMRAVTDVRVAVIEPDDFTRLVVSQLPIHRRVMRAVRTVSARTAAREQNRERLASLGTMAAGLAHELNNPAAAARRAADQMADALETLGFTIEKFVHSGIERDNAERMVDLHRAAVDRMCSLGPMDALDAADAEDDVRDHLEALGVPEPWKLAEPLAAAGVDNEWLDSMAETAGEKALEPALRWVAATLTARSLARELQESTERMSKLVKAVKTYAYMDRGELVEVDLHEGIETTIVVLGHKLKQTEIKVKRNYDKTLPKLTVHGSELNQVWTNLLDNAIDALGEKGTITISTRREGLCAVVDISDDGPGIPEEIRSRIFDSFMTTKEVGRGTGLGLATARRIVVERHSGSLSVDSRPGETTFHVWLPFKRTQPAE
jgi:signal transduction histidine kinase